MREREREEEGERIRLAGLVFDGNGMASTCAMRCVYLCVGEASEIIS